MGKPHIPAPGLLIVAAFSRYVDALEWARSKLETAFGPIAFASEPFDFNQTAYYERTMGPGLRKLFYVFRDLVSPDQLATIKRQTNDLEEELTATSRYPEPRPLNLDPGLLGLGKFILATTKDQAHRIYLRDGIYAEVTLRFHQGQFEPWPWTYPDYRQPEVLRFLERARTFYRQQLSA